MPTASLAHQAAEIIRRCADGTPADAALRDFARHHPRLPQARKRDLAGAVFAYFRWLGWQEKSVPLPVAVEETLARQERFARDPRSVKDQALVARAVPAWIWSHLACGEGPDAEARRAGWARSLQASPPLWLRARPGTTEALARALTHCQPVDPASPVAAWTPDALRFAGPFDLHRTPEFEGGRFEIQDLASQVVGAVCAPQPGETWWDTCAGEGGKSLHLADQMKNKGLVWCSDRSVRRLETLRRRFGRAQLFNYRAAAWDGGPRLPAKARFDGVLVDAPCSGAGTWARNPDARWTTTSQDVAELAAVQRQLLAHAAPSVKSGGRLVYAVCTLTRDETTAVAADFAAAHPDFEPVALSPALPAAPGGAGSMLWPHEIAGNGMYLAVWRRR